MLHFNRFASSINCLKHTLWVVFSFSPFLVIRASSFITFISANPYSFALSSSSPIESFSVILISSLSLSFAVPAMAHTKSTANPPPSSRNPPPQARRVAPRANPPPARNPPRASGAPSNQAERPTSSHANPTQATQPVTGGASLPPRDYKELYP